MDNLCEGKPYDGERALKEIYEETVNKAYYTALKYVQKEDVAQDMLQDAYISVFENLDKFDGGNLQSWVNTIIANKCKDYLKKKKPLFFTDITSMDGGFIPDIIDEDIEFSPEKSIDYSETKRLMTNILKALPEEQNLCITMFYYQEMSIKEIAEYFECSENTIKSRLNYARKTIKEKVVELEKSGTKLYGIPVFAFLTWMFTMESRENVFAQSASSQTVWNSVDKIAKQKNSTRIYKDNLPRETLKKVTGKQKLKWSFLPGVTKKAVIITCIVVGVTATCGVVMASNYKTQLSEVANQQQNINKETHVEETNLDVIETEQNTEEAVELNKESIIAYMNFLKNQNQLINYGLGTVDDMDTMYSKLKVNLFDMDSNGIPELFVNYEGDYTCTTQVCLFTYKDGNVTKLDCVGLYDTPYFLDDGSIMSCDIHMGADMKVYKLENEEISLEKEFVDDFGYTQERFYIDDVAYDKETYLKELKGYTQKILDYGKDVDLGTLIDKSDQEFELSLIKMMQDKSKLEHNKDAAQFIEEIVEN